MMTAGGEPVRYVARDRASGDQAARRIKLRVVARLNQARYKTAAMVLDDGGAQIDPATLPENIQLMQEIDEAIQGKSGSRLDSPSLGTMRELVIEALRVTTAGPEAALAEREADHPLETTSVMASPLRWARATRLCSPKAVSASQDGRPISEDLTSSSLVPTARWHSSKRSG
jgi:hypothetical protein